MLRALIRIGIDNPVLLNLAVLVTVTFGVLAWAWVPKEEFPRIRTDRVAVVAVWPGASAPQIEDGVVRPLEDALRDVPGIAHLFAEAFEDRAVLDLELERGVDGDTVRDEVRRRIASSAKLPADIPDPYVEVVAVQAQMLHIALIGDPRRVDLAEDLRDDLLAIDGVGDVIVDGAWSRVLRVELDPAKTSALRIGPAEVAAAIRAAGLAVPAGSLDVSGGDVVVRTPAVVRRPEDIVRVPLAVRDGTHIVVGDVGRVVEDWLPPAVTMRLGGQPAIDLTVLGSDNADTTAMVPILTAWAEARAANLPAGLELRAYDDAARFVNARLTTLGSNALMGLVLVGLLLRSFLGNRAALLVMAGLPVAYAGALGLAWWADVTINLVSLFGFLLVSGILVDDAIVVIDNIHRHREAGASIQDAAVEGTMEVVPSVTASTLTTVLAFAPLLLLDGLVGRILAIVPTVVILSLMVSLAEAFLVLPGHAAHHGGEAEPERRPWLLRQAEAVYSPMIDAMVSSRRRWLWLLTISVGTSALLALAATRRIELTTPGEPVFALVDVSLPPGADAQKTEHLVRELERSISEEHSELLLFVRSRLGEQLAPPSLPVRGARHAQIVMGFPADKALAPRIRTFLAELEEELSQRPDVASVGVTTLGGGPPVGKPVDLRVRGRDTAAVEAASDAVVAHLRTRPGVRDVVSDLGVGAPSFEVRVRPDAASRLGLSEAEVALAARAAIEGADSLDLPLAGRTTPTVVALPPLLGHAGLGDLPTLLPDGSRVRLRQVADVARTSGVERIGRVDGQRAIRITADVDLAQTSSTAEHNALDALMEGRAEAHPGVTVLVGGEQADTQRSFGRLPWAFAAAMLLNYALLASQFRSYVQPLVVLATVPIGLAGAVGGLLLWGMQLSLIAAIGAVALVGVVVNDAIVLMDFVNRARDEGLSTQEAVQRGATQRLRPILLTTVTTCGGLLPIALGIGGEEPLLAPMAVVLGLGLLVATVLVVVVVPLLLLIIDDLTPRRAPPEAQP